MNNEKFIDIIKEIENISDLHSQDIPDLNLYMDQIMTLFDTYLSDNKRYPEDKLLTKTMINNYSKEGLIKKIKGKKYSKDHILQMLLIYSLKNTITIQEIKKILSPYHEETNKIEPIYDQYLDIKKELSHLVTNSLTQIIEEHDLNLDDQDQLTLMILYICTLSNQYKMIAEKMLDTFYTDE